MVHGWRSIAAGSNGTWIPFIAVMTVLCPVNDNYFSLSWEAWERGGAEWERIRAPGNKCGRIERAFLEEERPTMGTRRTVSSNH